MALRILKTLIDRRVDTLTQILDDAIDIEYGWINKFCDMHGYNKDEYFDYYTKRIDKYLRGDQGNNDEKRV